VSVEGCQVAWVAADHGVPAVARADHDGCVDDISGARVPAEGTGGTSPGLVERYDRDGGEPEEASETGLASATAPCPCDNARWHGEIGAGGLCFVE